MLDLYLNMPTKGAFETPLHLAAKMGHLETVRVLVQQPACKRDLTNKFGQTPEQVGGALFRVVEGFKVVLSYGEF